MPYPKVSIIVPVFNSENELSRCVDSLLNQKYSNFELLLIDDGSKDRSGEICDEFSKKDSRVHVFHKSNNGVSSARNIGLEHAKGEWICFCDSDDWVSEFYISNLISHIDPQIDLVFSYATIVFGDGKTKRENYSAKYLSVDNLDSAFLDNDISWHSSPWSKLYRKSIIDSRKLRFCEKLHIGEDFVFLYSYLLLCRNIYISSDADYFYNFEASNSLTKKLNSFESEYGSYMQISILINKMINLKIIRTNEVKSQFRLLKGIYVRRVLSSLYSDNIRRSKRIDIIRKIEVADYLDTAHIVALKERFLAFLLAHKCIYTYDVVRFIAKKINN